MNVVLKKQENWMLYSCLSLKKKKKVDLRQTNKQDNWSKTNEVIYLTNVAQPLLY